MQDVEGLLPRSETVWLLLQWVQAVVAPTSIQVTNFTTSFADGTVLCLLVRFTTNRVPAQNPQQICLTQVYEFCRLYGKEQRGG